MFSNTRTRPIQPNVCISSFNVPTRDLSTRLVVNKLEHQAVFPRLVYLANMCHVVGMMHLQKQLAACPHFPPTVGKCNTSRRNHKRLFAYQIETCCVPTSRLYLTSRQVTCVCGKSSSLGTSSGEGGVSFECDHNDQATYGKCTGVECFPNKPGMETV